MDKLVILKQNSAGLQNEWAGAIFAVSYKNGVPDPKHVGEWLTKQSEWVFGDFKGSLKKSSGRLLRRILHRVIRQHLPRDLTEDEVKLYIKETRKLKRPVVKNSK